MPAPDRKARGGRVRLCYDAIMKWKPAPIIKVYEALGTLADGRIKIEGEKASVFSSSGNKHYDVLYDAHKNAIASNDNGSFWQGYLGYPAIAYLLATGVVEFDQKLAGYLKGFAWKDINQKFKNDFAKTQNYIDAQVAERHGVDISAFHSDIQTVLDMVNGLGLERLASGKRPPVGY
jgi:hypothetical protein